MTISLFQLLKTLDEFLNPQNFNDYCPNGLQIEGRPEVSKLITGVTASQALVDQAIAEGADAILVHHGYFWKGENPCIQGMKKKRLAALLNADVSLIAYHLPLDVHPEVGNNVQLAARLGIHTEGGLEPGKANSIGLYGRLAEPMSASKFAELVQQRLGRKPLHIDAGPTMIERVGWCTGAAQGYIDHAVDLGLDAFITGEVSEPTYHTAMEQGIHFYAAGHHATERYGVQALGRYLEETLGLQHQFIDVDNPV